MWQWLSAMIRMHRGMPSVLTAVPCKSGDECAVIRAKRCKPFKHVLALFEETCLTLRSFSHFSALFELCQPNVEVVLTYSCVFSKCACSAGRGLDAQT